MCKSLQTLLLLAVTQFSCGAAFSQLQISEFSAASDDAFPDSDGDSSDWIEIHNAGASELSTAGYFLTDDAGVPSMWALPDVAIPASGHLIVFASGKDRAVAGSELHGNFSLSASGEHLALIKPDGSTPASEYDYPKQVFGISYGTGGYFATPTPGTANGAVDFTDFVRDTNFSVDRGLFDAPFSVEITTATAGATIYYTTDGSWPSASNGAPYDELTPVAITTTTVLRAVASKAGLLSSDVDTHTYIFPDDVVHQPAAPAGFPSTWGIDNSTHLGGTGLPRPADYAMDPEILAQYGEQAVIDGLRHHPTVALVMDPDDWFNESTDRAIGGAYSNPYGGSGFNGYPFPPRDWERAGSVEFIGFPKTAGEQANCGIRIAGNFARHPNRYKHHLRLAFRGEYGPTKLKAPLFSRTSVDTFDNLILRCGNSESWTFPNNTDRPQVQYLRDQYFKDTQQALGQLSTNLEYVHVYINGLYWGLYTLLERVDATFLAGHLGGEDEDYDAIKASGTVIDGDDAAWDAMFAISRSGLAGDANYAAIAEYLDIDALIDYMLVNFHGGMTDWGKNWRGGRRREPGAGFKFFCWDAERSLGGPGSADHTKDVTGVNTNNHSTELHQDLTANAEYRLRFADHVQKYCFNGGALTPEACAARYSARADEIRPSLITESARWGDRWQPGDPHTIDNDWKTELESLINGYFPLRTDSLIGQLKAKNLFPDLAAPTFSQRGGFVPAGFNLLLNSDSTSIYYTVDGSDPRLPGGTINPEALMIPGTMRELTLLETKAAGWSYYDEGEIVEDWTAAAFDDSLWQTSTAPLGFGNITNHPLGGPDINPDEHLTFYVRRELEVERADLITDASIQVMSDGGAVVYLNGVEIARDNMPDGEILFGTPSLSDANGGEGSFDTFTFLPSHLVEGTNLVAVEVHNRTATSSDMGIDLQIDITGLTPDTPTVPIDATTTVRARAFDGVEWSAIDEATFTTGVPATSSNLAISEIYYNPPGGSESTEFIELLNFSDEVVSLSGVSFTDGVSFAFADSAVLAPGERVLVVSNLAAFEAAFGGGLPVAGAYDGQLDNSGETLTLSGSGGAVIASFQYGQDGQWPEVADGGGHSLVFIPPGADPTAPENWRPSLAAGGNPGVGDHTQFAGGDPQALLAYALGAGEGLEVSVRAIEVGGVTDNYLVVAYPAVLGADDVVFDLQFSDGGLAVWQGGQAVFLGSEVPVGGTNRRSWRAPLSIPADDGATGFARLVLSLRD